MFAAFGTLEDSVEIFFVKLFSWFADCYLFRVRLGSL